MITDGREIDHSLKNERGLIRKATGYDQVWSKLDETGVRMLGDHAERGSTYSLLLPTDEKIGSVSFDKDDQFLGGVWFGDPIISGRVNTKREALALFILKVEEVYG